MPAATAVSRVTVQWHGIVDAVDEFVINLFGKIFKHLLTVEHQLSKIIRRPFGRDIHISRLSSRKPTQLL
jgi:hypothetical protein